MGKMLGVSSLLNLGLGYGILPNNRGINIQNVEIAIPKTRQNLINLSYHAGYPFEQKAGCITSYDVPVGSVIGEAYPTQCMACFQGDYPVQRAMRITPLQLHNIERDVRFLQFL